MSRFVPICLLLVLLLPNLSYPNEDFLRVMAAGNVAIRLAVLTPAPASGAIDTELSEEIAAIFKLDLGITGLFALVDLPVQGNSVAISGADADMVLKTAYTVAPTSVTFEYRLQETVTGREILAKRYSAVRQDLRKTAHTFSDDLLYALTGERGSFTGKMAYVSASAGKKDIYIMDWDGFNPRKIVANGSINLNPEFSPSGRELIYTSYKNGNPDLFRRELFTGAEATVSHAPGINITGAFSPEGNRIALAMSKDGNSEIYLLTKDGKQLARLTHNPAIDISPSWSPNGRQIAFVSDRFGKPQIFIMSFDGNDQKRITVSGGYNVSPRWSPKGDRIVYCRQYGNGFQIHLINPDGSDDRQITTEGSNEHPRWSPDGRFIVYSSKRGGKEAIYVMRSDGSGSTRISRSNVNETHPTWSARW